MQTFLPWNAFMDKNFREARCGGAKRWKKVAFGELMPTQLVYSETLPQKKKSLRDGIV